MRGRFVPDFRSVAASPRADAETVSRWGRTAVYAGVIATVGGLSKAHAVAHEYSWSQLEPLRLVARLRVAPLPRRLQRGAARAAAHPPRRVPRRAASPTASAALVISGVAALRRRRAAARGSSCSAAPSSSCRGSCSAAAFEHDVDARAGERDRVVVVATADEFARSRPTSRTRSSVRRSLVGWLTPVRGGVHARTPPTAPVRSVDECARGAPRHRRGAEPGRAGRRRHRGAGLGAPRDRRPRPDALAVLRAVARQASRSASSSASRCSSTSASCTPSGYARVKRLLDLALAALGLRGRSPWSRPWSLVGDLIGNRGPLLLPPAARPAATARPSRS